MRLIGCSNPGWYFSLIRIQQLNSMYCGLCELEQDKEYSYINLQIEIEKKCPNVDKSKTRMFIPFLVKLGVLSDNHGELSKIITPFGKKLFCFLGLYEKIYLSNNEEAINISEKILSYFLINGYKSLLNDKEDVIYYYLIKILSKLEYIVKNEFFLITTVLKELLDKEESIKEQEILKLIKDYRDGKIENIQIVKNINAFNYIMPFVESCNLVFQKDEKYYLNKSKSKLLGVEFDG